ncbi:MAG: hypothetical protein O3A80_03380 [bacterium]|nr:hypothetical protein [bacterium]
MINPTIVPVKQFTPSASVPVVELHTALIAIMALSMMMSLPTLG